MNEIVNRFLWPGDEFMPPMHLRQPGFTYSAYRSFAKKKKKKEYKNLRKQEIHNIFMKRN